MSENISLIHFLKGLTLMMGLLCAGCSEDILIDPFVDNRLNIWSDPLPEGKVGEPYEAVIGAEVENTPFDNDYDITFRLVDSELPPGLVFTQEDIRDQTRGVIRGVPLEAGTTMIVIRAFSRRLQRQQEREEEEEREDRGFFRVTNTRAEDEEIFTLIIRE